MRLNSTSANELIIKIIIFIVIITIIIMRRPDIITNAQPWAEDGTIWIQSIYNNGLIDSIVKPQNGYYQTIARIIYSFSLLFGLENAPLIANISSILVRVVFIFFLLSKRFSYIDIKLRLAFVCYFLFMPNISEGYVNATNVQWYLSIYMISFLVAEEPISRAWKIHDFTLITISSLSGPFVVFLSIPYLFKRVKESSGISNTLKSFNLNDFAFLFCFIVQFLAILHSQSQTRSSAPLGASIFLFCDIFYYKLVRGLLFDNAHITGDKNVISHVLITISFFASLIYLFFKKSWRYTVVLLSVLLIVGFGLAKPMMSLDKPQWDFFLLPVGDRYFLIPQLGVFCVILSFISLKEKIATLLLSAFTLVCVIFYVKSYKIERLPDINYRGQIESFNKLNPGENSVIDIYPPGWKINLIKK